MIYPRLFNLVWIIALASSLSQPHAQSRVLTIATEGYFRPYNLTRSDGTLDGYEVELGQHLCQTMKVECNFIAIPFDAIITSLQIGKADAVMGALSATKAREKVIDFSVSYGRTPQVFATLRDGPYSKLPHMEENLDLSDNKHETEQALQDVNTAIKGATVGVVGGSIAQSLINAYFREGTTIREYKNAEQVDLDLANGRIDMQVTARSYLNTIQKTQAYSDVVMTGPLFKGGLLGRGVAVGLRKDEADLKRQFDSAIMAAKADGTIKRLSERWFGFDVTP
ncbi:MAG: transporter substrate-binding domain-containing protein [Brucella intermedia]